MKVIQINCTYNKGSTGKIVYLLHDYLLKQGDDSLVLYGVGENNIDSNIIKVVSEPVRKIQSLFSRISGYAYAGHYFGTKKVIQILEKEKPDLVHIHCVNAYMMDVYKVLTYLKQKDISTVITMHAEFLYTSGCSYAIDCQKFITGCDHCPKIGKERPNSWFFDKTNKEWNLMKDAYSSFNRLLICAVSPWQKERINLSPFFEKSQIRVVMNGIDTSVFKYYDGNALKKKLGLIGKKIVIHVTPNFQGVLKGGKYVLEIAKKLENQKDIVFLIVGKNVDENTLPKNVIHIDHTENQVELAKLYSMSDLCLITSKRETFSMVTAESLCCGTPVSGFKAGGPETISLPNYSAFVDYGDIKSLISRINELLREKHEKKIISKIAQSKYSEYRMCTEYKDIYYEMLEHYRVEDGCKK